MLYKTIISKHLINTFTKMQLHALNVAMYLGIIPLICFIGALSNLLLLITLSKHIFGNTFYNYLSAIAVLDLASIVFTVPVLITRCPVCPFYDNTNASQILATFIFVGIEKVFIVSSCWTLLALVFDCCMQTCSSDNKLAARLRVRSPWLLIFLISMGSIVENLPTFWYYQLDNEGRLAARQHHETVFVAYSWVDIFLTGIIYMIMLCVFNICLVWRYQHSACEAVSRPMSLSSHLLPSVCFSLQQHATHPMFHLSQTQQNYHHHNHKQEELQQQQQQQQGNTAQRCCSWCLQQYEEQGQTTVPEPNNTDVNSIPPVEADCVSNKKYAHRLSNLTTSHPQTFTTAKEHTIVHQGEITNDNLHLSPIHTNHQHQTLDTKGFLHPTTHGHKDDSSDTCSNTTFFTNTHPTDGISCQKKDHLWISIKIISALTILKLATLGPGVVLQTITITRETDPDEFSIYLTVTTLMVAMCNSGNLYIYLVVDTRIRQAFRNVLTSGLSCKSCCGTKVYPHDDSRDSVISRTSHNSTPSISPCSVVYHKDREEQNNVERQSSLTGLPSPRDTIQFFREEVTQHNQNHHHLSPIKIY